MRPAIRLAVLLGFVVALTACSGTSPEATDQPATTTEVGAPASSETPSAAAPETGVTVDLGGRELHVGTDAAYPPFESLNDANVVEGIDPDILAAACAIANCVAQFENTNWDGIFGALATGEFDVLMSAITILPERETDSNATFTTPYFEVGQVVLVPVEGSTITAAEDLANGMKVGVQTGTTGDTAATDMLKVPDENMSRFGTNVLAVEALLNGDVDAVVVDSPTAGIYVQQHEGKLKVLGAPFTTEQYGILVPNSTPEVLSALNAAIDALKSSGQIDAIVAQHYTP